MVMVYRGCRAMMVVVVSYAVDYNGGNEGQEIITMGMVLVPLLALVVILLFVQDCHGRCEDKHGPQSWSYRLFKTCSS